MIILCLCLSFFLFGCLSVCLFVCLFVCLYVLCVCLPSLCLFACFGLFVCLYIIQNKGLKVNCKIR